MGDGTYDIDVCVHYVCIRYYTCAWKSVHLEPIYEKKAYLSSWIRVDDIYVCFLQYSLHQYLNIYVNESIWIYTHGYIYRIFAHIHIYIYMQI
jgi:hypothetical protein